MPKWLQNCLWLYFCAINYIGVSSNPQLWEIPESSKNVHILDLQSRGLLDIWSGQNQQTQVIVEAENADEVQKRLSDAHLKHNVIEEDFLRLIEQEEKNLEHKRSKRSVERMDWTSYHKLEDIEGYLGWLNATNYGRVSVISAAVTYEGRNVYVVRVTDPNTQGPKKKIWIEGGIHAREWISPAAAMFLLHRVATSPEFGPILAKTDWFFVPVANPDGYEHSFKGGRARMWRKNRSRSKERSLSQYLTGGNRCRGTDLNRNWSLKWGVGASSHPCSEVYKGSVPFSEPETDGLRRLMEREAPFDLFITLHSFGQSVLYPWGWTKKSPRNVKDLIKLGRRFVDSVRYASKGRTEYKLGGSGEVYGLASGASDDWAYGALSTPYSYTIELRDTGKYGFLLPENQIMETVHETALGIYCMVSYLVNVGRCSGPTRRVEPVEPRGIFPTTRRNKFLIFN